MIAKYAVLTALSLILGYVETLIPIPVPVPGIKIGIANIVTIVAFSMVDKKGAWIISIVRILLSALLFGNMYSLVFSLAGGVCSLLFMTIALASGKFSNIGISIIGGTAHNIGQTVAAILVLDAAVIAAYIPVLIVGGIISGIITGFLATIIINRIRKAGKTNE